MTQPTNPLQSEVVAKLMADPAFLASIEKATGIPVSDAPSGAAPPEAAAAMAASAAAVAAAVVA